MGKWSFVAACVGLVALAGSVTAQRKPVAVSKPAARPGPPVVTPPKARYAMDVATVSGFGGMMAGGQPDMAQMMRMAEGDGESVSHTLSLRLGSTLVPSGTPDADHFFTPPARMGPSVPLLTPQPGRLQRDIPTDFERPKGRLILFWGCGARAPAGQPVIIDFANLAAGQVPPDLFSARAPVDRGPSVSNSRTYAEWPNQRSGRMPEGGTLIGEHRIAANYAPEVRFALQQDYMAGLQLNTAIGRDDAIALSWGQVPMATGYYAWAIGASGGGRRGRNDAGDIVWWSSSNNRDFGGALWDWISPPVVAGLVRDGTVMAPSATSCTMPAEVRKATGEGMIGNMVAYGPEENFVYPLKPATGPWNQEWTARVRFRSMTSFIPDMDMSAMGGNRRGADRSEPAKKRCKPSLFAAVTGLGC